jgi:hypothetical protein
MGKFIMTWVTYFICALVIGLLLVWPLVWMWNFVMPDVFGLSEITYWQMFWMYCLIQILFKMNITVNNKN